MYSLNLRNELSGSEDTLATAEYKDNILSLSFTVPTQKQPWWYKYKDFFTPALLLMMLIKRS